MTDFGVVAVLWTMLGWITHAHATASPPAIRGLYHAFTLPDAPSPVGTGRMKVLYPASNPTALVTPADVERAPFPVVVFFGGALVESNRYQWLGERLVEELGVVFVSYDVLDSVGGITGAVADADYTTNAETVSKTMIVLRKSLEDLNEAGILAGLLDLSRVVWGGHSAGARILMMNAKSEFFRGMVGVFSYGGHSASGPTYGAPPATILPLNNSVPVLLMVGKRDGVIEYFGFVYGTRWTSGAEPVRRTFDEALSIGVGGYYAAFDGFNHFSIVDPVDMTMGTAYLDHESLTNKAKMKDALCSIISLFVRARVFADRDAETRLRQQSLSKPVQMSPFDYSQKKII